MRVATRRQFSYSPLNDDYLSFSNHVGIIVCALDSISFRIVIRIVWDCLINLLKCYGCRQEQGAVQRWQERLEEENVSCMWFFDQRNHTCKK